MEYADLLIENHGKVAVIRLNRPKAMNALNDNMMNELGDALYKFDADPGVNVIIVTGSEKVFAAGADIAAMAEYTYARHLSRQLHRPQLGTHPERAQTGGRRGRRLLPWAAAANWR